MISRIVPIVKKIMLARVGSAEKTSPRVKKSVDTGICIVYHVPMKPKAYCKYCGAELEAYTLLAKGVPKVRWRRVCFSCNPYDRETEWERHKRYAQSLVSRFPQKVMVTFICSCATKRKIRHHYDYSRPMHVHLLCGSCHIKDHPEAGVWKPNQKGETI